MFLIWNRCLIGDLESLHKSKPALRFCAHGRAQLAHRRRIGNHKSACVRQSVWARSSVDANSPTHSTRISAILFAPWVRGSLLGNWLEWSRSRWTPEPIRPGHFFLSGVPGDRFSSLGWMEEPPCMAPERVRSLWNRSRN